MDVREKGHRLERQVVNMMKKLGFNSAKTTRANNKTLDACGVDIDNVPFYIQCKSGYTKGLNYSAIFEYMKSKLIKEFGTIDKPMIIIHKKGRKKYDNLVVIDNDDEYMVMAYDDFVNKLISFNELPRTSIDESVAVETTSDKPPHLL